MFPSPECSFADVFCTVPTPLAAFLTCLKPSPPTSNHSLRLQRRSKAPAQHALLHLVSHNVRFSNAQYFFVSRYKKSLQRSPALLAVCMAFERSHARAPTHVLELCGSAKLLVSYLLYTTLASLLSFIRLAFYSGLGLVALLLRKDCNLTGVRFHAKPEQIPPTRSEDTHMCHAIMGCLLFGSDITLIISTEKKIFLC